MAALPLSSAFTGPLVTEGDFKTAITGMRDFLSGLLGTDGVPATARTALGIVTFPATTRMAFQQTAAPSGWTKDSTAALNDSIMRIVTGTAGSGGTTAFSTFSAQTVTGSTTLSESQIPSHTHTTGQSFISGSSFDENGTTMDSPPYNSTWTTVTGAKGGGGGHTHPLTHAIKYYDFIIAVKD